jgi:hypothetical protein
MKKYFYRFAAIFYFLSITLPSGHAAEAISPLPKIILK